MPSHIFRASAIGRNRSAHTEAARSPSQQRAHDQLHAMDYLVYAYLQMGQDAKAQAVIDEIAWHRRLRRDVYCRGPMRWP